MLLVRTFKSVFDFKVLGDSRKRERATALYWYEWYSADRHAFRSRVQCVLANIIKAARGFDGFD